MFSVCTLTAAESTGVDGWLATARPDLVPEAPVGDPWQPWGRGAVLLPQTAGTDGMCMFRYVRSGTATGGATEASAAPGIAGGEPAGEES